MEQGGNALVRPIIFSFRRAFCISRRSYVDLSRRPLMPASLVSDISSWLLRINLPRPCSSSEHRRLHLTRFDLVKKSLKAWKAVHRQIIITEPDTLVLPNLLKSTWKRQSLWSRIQTTYLVIPEKMNHSIWLLIIKKVSGKGVDERAIRHLFPALTWRWFRWNSRNANSSFENRVIREHRRNNFVL